MQSFENDPPSPRFDRVPGRHRPLTAREERELGWRIINDECTNCREKLVQANLPLVDSIARNYAGRGLPLADLIEAGEYGLLRAVEEFDPAKGRRFSTHASWWIKQSIKWALPLYTARQVARTDVRSPEMNALRDRLEYPASCTAQRAVPRGAPSQAGREPLKGTPMNNSASVEASSAATMRQPSRNSDEGTFRHTSDRSQRP
mgnify:CR=1 FL=1